MARLFPACLVGSYPQPDWLIDREKLAAILPPRTRVEALWRIPPDYLREAMDDATRIAIRAQEAAGLDIITDGEVRRESYSNRFATSLSGIDLDHPGIARSRSGEEVAVPRIVGRIKRMRAVEVQDLKFLKDNIAMRGAQVKMTLPGPFTMTQQAQNDFYASTEDVAMAYAGVVNEEVAELFAAGADVVQLDEPYLQARPEEARAYGLKALNRALQGIKGTTAVHICFGYAKGKQARPAGYSFLPEMRDCGCGQVSIETAQANLDTSALEPLRRKKVIVGVLNLADMEIETPEMVASRIRRALPHADPENIIVAPDCGMKYLPRQVADGKLRAMVEGAAIVRRELTGQP